MSEHTMREALEAVVRDVKDLAAASRGVQGLHLNGDLATWNWLFENEWLGSIARAEAALSASPPPAAQEGEVPEEVRKALAALSEASYDRLPSAEVDAVYEGAISSVRVALQAVRREAIEAEKLDPSRPGEGGPCAGCGSPWTAKATDVSWTSHLHDVGVAVCPICSYPALVRLDHEAPPAEKPGEAQEAFDSRIDIERAEGRLGAPSASAPRCGTCGDRGWVEETERHCAQCARGRRVPCPACSAPAKEDAKP